MIFRIQCIIVKVFTHDIPIEVEDRSVCSGCVNFADVGLVRAPQELTLHPKLVHYPFGAADFGEVQHGEGCAANLGCWKFIEV